MDGTGENPSEQPETSPADRLDRLGQRAGRARRAARSGRHAMTGRSHGHDVNACSYDRPFLAPPRSPTARTLALTRHIPEANRRGGPGPGERAELGTLRVRQTGPGDGAVFRPGTRRNSRQGPLPGRSAAPRGRRSPCARASPSPRPRTGPWPAGPRSRPPPRRSARCPGRPPGAPAHRTHCPPGRRGTGHGTSPCPASTGVAPSAVRCATGSAWRSGEVVARSRCVRFFTAGSGSGTGTISMPRTTGPGGIRRPGVAGRTSYLLCVG